MLSCKLFLGKVKPDTMKIEIARKGNRKIEWRFIHSLKQWRNIKHHCKALKTRQYH